MCSGLTAFSEEQTRQQTIDLSPRQTSPANPSTGFYESLDTSRPEAVVYAHMSHSSEPAYENRAVRPWSRWRYSTGIFQLNNIDVGAVVPLVIYIYRIIKKFSLTIEFRFWHVIIETTVVGLCLEATSLNRPTGMLKALINAAAFFARLLYFYYINLLFTKKLVAHTQKNTKNKLK